MFRSGKLTCCGQHFGCFCTPQLNITLIPQLEERKAENEATCESLRERIQQLWDRLQVSQEDRAAMNEHLVSSRKRNLEAVRKLKALLYA